MEEGVVLQLTLEVKEDVYLLVSGSGINNSDISILWKEKFIGRIMDLNDKWVNGFER